MFRVQEDVWVEVGNGLSRKVYRHGTLIPEAEAEALGLLLVKKERAIEDKKERKAATKRTAAAKRTPTEPKE